MFGAGCSGCARRPGRCRQPYPQLAIEFAHRIVARHPDTWVFWVHAGTQAWVDEGFRAVADAAKLPGRNHPKANIPQLVYATD
jgi:hypothetical protein